MLEHLPILKPDHPYPVQLPEILSPCLVIDAPLFREMPRPVQLDGQAAFGTIEIEYEAVYAELPAETHSVHLPPFEAGPEEGFGRRSGGTEFAAEGEKGGAVGVLHGVCVVCI